jgi:DNA-binding NtrC family response regulator
MSEGQPYRLLVVDLNITRNLQDLIARILAEQPNAGVIVASAAPTWRRAREALQAGAIDFINKTLNQEELLSIFRNALIKTPPACGEEGGCTNE